MQLNYTVGSSPAPQNDFQPLAAGTYPGQIVEWAEHTSKSGNQCLRLQVRLENGRVLWDYLVMQAADASNSKSATAIEIAKQRLDSIGSALGLQVIAHADDLLAKPLSVNVGVRPPSNGFDASNEIKGYAAASMPSQGQPAAAASAPPAPQPVSPPASSTPWS